MTRERLLNGWDDIGLTLRRGDAITSYEMTSVAPSLDGLFDSAGRIHTH
jgi:3-isopropylmalate dehydratase small subunit